MANGCKDSYVLAVVGVTVTAVCGDKLGTIGQGAAS